MGFDAEKLLEEPPPYSLHRFENGERMLNELIERVEVHHAEKVDGVHRQKLTIYYNCVGSIEIPEICRYRNRKF